MDTITRYLTSPTAPTLFPQTAIGLFIFSYAALSTRFAKLKLKIDHNVSPREDLDKYGSVAVAKGRITQKQLDRLRRQEGAHANAVENLPFFLAAMLLAHYAKLPNCMINKLCLAYTTARLAYSYAYLNIETPGLSSIRSLAWWAGNITCFVAFSRAGKALNGHL